jgi:hypothetical protein
MQNTLKKSSGSLASWKTWARQLERKTANELGEGAEIDLSGNVWFTCNIPNKRTTIGRVDSKTGEVKLLKVPGANGLAAGAHGMTRDPDGIIWFNVNLAVADQPARPQDREDRCVLAANRHVADRQSHHRRLRRQGHDLVVLSGGCAALRSADPIVHRVQVGHLQDPKRHRRYLWSSRRSGWQRLLGRNGARHSRGRRRRDW